MCRIPTSCLERAKGFRARLESWLHRPEPGAEAGSAALGGKLSRDRGKLSEEALGWRDSFDQLLHNPRGLAAFRAFLRTEFSEENLEFWLACEDFKRTRPAAKLASRAHRIFEEFVRTEAPREVNIDHETRELTRRNLEAATAACFDQAQGQARALMEKDSFRRFLRSPAYLALLAGAPQPSHA